MEIIFRQLGACYYVVASLARGRSVIYSCYWTSPAQSFSHLSPAALMTIFYCLNFDTLPAWRAGSCIYFPSEQGGPVIPPSLGSLFVASYNSQGHASIRETDNCKVKVKVIFIDWISHN
jgi:hypothetical protein